MTQVASGRDSIGPAPAGSAALDLFIEKAKAVSAFVEVVDSFDAALAKAATLCIEKDACTLIPAGCDGAVSGAAAAFCPTRERKTLAAPKLDPALAAKLAEICRENDVEFIESGMRRWLEGVDVGLTIAQNGLAATGTLILDSRDEDLRLATMLCELHVAILPESRLLPSSGDFAPTLGADLKRDAAYLGFVTGASRTADIERVLALGVHGPLELHIFIVRNA